MRILHPELILGTLELLMTIDLHLLLTTHIIAMNENRKNRANPKSDADLAEKPSELPRNGAVLAGNIQT